MKKNWEIRYYTGAGDFEFFGTVEDAMEKADEGAAYTQESYTIASDDGEKYIRQWIGTEYDPDESESTEEEIIAFGKFGYFDAWQDWE